jgi:hypothetical protein
MQSSATTTLSEVILSGNNSSIQKASGPVAPATRAQAAASKQAAEPDVNFTPGAVRPQPAKIQTVPVTKTAMLAVLWFVGATLVLLRLAVGTWRVGQLAREGARVEDGMWLSLTQRLANRLGVTRPLTLLRGEKLAVPVTWGVIYPAVLLPQDADSWSEERRRFVLVHEMAHVKRFDALTQLQVDERADWTPERITRRFAARGPKAATGRRRTPGFIRRRTMPVLQEVNGVREPWTFGYLIDVMLTRDPWMHRLDIAAATGTESRLTADHDGVIVADVVTEWADRHGKDFELTLTGPAGGTWRAGANGPSWTLDAVDFCRAIARRPASTTVDDLLNTEVPY